MPYQKLVTFYTREERRRLHAQGIWIDRDGNQLSVRNMDYFRLNKLVRTLATWAMKEPNPYHYLSNHAIFIHVWIRIVEVGIRNHYTEMFSAAYENSIQENRIWQR